MISLVINADTRLGADAEICEHEHKILGGVHSYDFLTDGVRNKIAFFEGHETEVILYIDEHVKLPMMIAAELDAMMCDGQIQKLVCKPHDRTHRRFNEILYLDALKMATGRYVVHFDGDCAAFKAPESKITTRYLQWLASGYKFICQPTTLSEAEHQMWWASTRFFICERESLHFDELERAIQSEDYRARFGHCPAFEHVLGRIAGKDGVLYPPAEWDDYVVFSWSRYHRSLLKRLNEMPYSQVKDYILDCGILGPNDLNSKPLPSAEELADVADLERNEEQ